ncbi:ankyrin repeat and LEM domain-containing protein 2-like [Oscarella lobularis]|uniref:ankyrin repeat and LEM domain-containing protein 2-like n=1 Tax=Oscarella lobularis TaxID=121494 RepID=UPI0033144B2D
MAARPTANLVENARHLSDDELRSRLIAYGLEVGPVTASTRSFYERKLAQCFAPISEREEKPPSVAEPIETQAKSVPESPSVYYGVRLPRNDEGEGNFERVYVSHVDAHEAARRVKGARFKGFLTRAEAMAYAQTTEPTTDPVASEEKNAYKSPTPQQLTELRMSVQEDNFSKFSRMVDENPRFLIGSGDTPVAIHLGPHWNALHVMSIFDRTEMAQFLVNILKSDAFWKKILPDDDVESRERRKAFLIDLYLNMPDKTNCETPLLLASKFGCVAMVKFLLSQASLNVNCRNAHGQTAIDLAAMRCKDDGSHNLLKKELFKREIRQLLTDNVYVPLYRSLDNTTLPLIGQPWSPDPKHSPIRIARNNSARRGGPIVVSHGEELFSGGGDSSSSGRTVQSSPTTVCAYAGPMSAEKAQLLYKDWSSPVRGRSREEINIRRSDSERGMERIGRRLAHTKGVPWVEYWPFLDDYVDLLTPGGLQALEEYFTKQWDCTDVEDPLAEQLAQLSLSPSFITGKEPSKMDQDVLNALGNRSIQEDLYPNVSKWKKLVLGYSNEERQRWSTPRRKVSRRLTETREMMSPVLAKLKPSQSPLVSHSSYQAPPPSRIAKKLNYDV